MYIAHVLVPRFMIFLPLVFTLFLWSVSIRYQFRYHTDTLISRVLAVPGRFAAVPGRFAAVLGSFCSRAGVVLQYVLHWQWTALTQHRKCIEGALGVHWECRSHTDLIQISYRSPTEVGKRYQNRYQIDNIMSVGRKVMKNDHDADQFARKLSDLAERPPGYKYRRLKLTMIQSNGH